jgi:hypothetical protein
LQTRIGGWIILKVNPSIKNTVSHCKESSFVQGLLKARDFLDQPNNSHLLKNDSAPLGYLNCLITAVYVQPEV